MGFDIEFAEIKVADSKNAFSQETADDFFEREDSSSGIHRYGRSPSPQAGQGVKEYAPPYADKDVFLENAMCQTRNVPLHARFGHAVLFAADS